jgi:hypothetical protein
LYQSNALQQPLKGQIDLFRERLPAKPYHTDDLNFGLHIAGVDIALKARYIQPNGPTHKYWLVYDIDRPGAIFDWRDRGAPPPNIVVVNSDNHHGHLIYGLEVPVRTAPDGSSAALRYAAAIDCALADLLGADLGYTGLICKNPCHDHWQTHVWEPHLYDLDGLASWLDLTKYSDRRRKLPDYGVARNCNLFDDLRQWAYTAIRQGWPGYDQWYQACLTRAEGYNIRIGHDSTKGPLPYNEVKSVAKSVARYTYQRFSPTGFSAWQAVQGAKGGKKSRGGGRPSKRDELMPVIQERLEQEWTKTRIATELNITTRTLQNWLSDSKPEKTSHIR